MTFYRIRDWAKHFENNRTKEIVRMTWVPVPNKHDGEGFQRIMREPDGIVIYGCWHLILQVASKCLRERGTLLRDDGTPMTAECISLKTGWRKAEDIQRALDFLSSPQVAWIEALGTPAAAEPQEGAVAPQVARAGESGTVLNGTEQNGHSSPVPPASPEPPRKKKAVKLEPYSPDFEAFWRDFPVVNQSPKGAKGEAWEAWKAVLTLIDGQLVGTTPAEMLTKAAKERRGMPVEQANGTHTKHVCRWLKDRCWDSDPPPAAKPPPSTPPRRDNIPPVVTQAKIDDWLQELAEKKANQP